MKQVFQSIWWWARLGTLAVVALYVLVLLARNADQSANIWYWPGRPAESTSIIALALLSFIAGGLICTIGWALLSAWIGFRRTQEIRRKRLIAERRDEFARKAAMLRVKPAPQPTIRRPSPPATPASVTPEPIVEPLVPRPVAKPAPTPAVVVIAEPGVVVPAPRVELVEEGAAPIAVEAHRATPFASTPIAPGAKPQAEPLEEIEQPPADSRPQP